MDAMGAFLLGMLSGSSMILAVTVSLMLVRAIAIVPRATRAERRHLLFTSPLFMLVVVALEELGFRYILVGWLSTWTSVPVAVAASALIDFLIHVPNGPQSVLTFVNSALFSVVASMFYLRHGLAAAVGFHWGWNLMQWTVLGYPMYGRAVGRWMHVVPTGAAWLTGAEYGPEKSLLAGLVLALGAVILSLFP
jgi:membrane protease YdiL (CAAX protease family)